MNSVLVPVPERKKGHGRRALVTAIDFVHVWKGWTNVKALVNPRSGVSTFYKRVGFKKVKGLPDLYWSHSLRLVQLPICGTLSIDSKNSLHDKLYDRINQEGTIMAHWSNKDIQDTNSFCWPQRAQPGCGHHPRRPRGEMQCFRWSCPQWTQNQARHEGHAWCFKFMNTSFLRWECGSRN